MPANYVLLAEQTVSVAVASVTFSDIPQTGYTDLIVKYSVRGSASSGDVRIEFNGSGGTAYSDLLLYFDGASAASANASSQARLTWGGFINRSGTTDNTFASNEVYIPNYTSSNNKTVSVNMVEESNVNSPVYSGIAAGVWVNSAAITSIKLFPAAGNFVANSTFYLYGVAKLGVEPVIAPKASGGDIVVNDGTYWYHAFLSSGLFTPTQALSCDYLVVAGGGGGAGQYYYQQGGGGAGGLRSTVTATGGGGSLESALSLASGTGYTVTIGAGGAGALGPLSGPASSHRGAIGSNSVFATITSTGGGGGAASDGTATSGGSGGGAGDVSGAAGTTGQGYAGGASNGGSGWSVGGGGGGAGAVGGNGTNPTPGAGGAGVQIGALAIPTNTGANSGYYAGGGGGGSYDSLSVGAGGSGGGGAGSSTSTGVSGTVNTGGGGGAGSKYFSTYYNGGSGGSGIVIVRYLVA